MSPSVRYCHRASTGQLLQDLHGKSPSVRYCHRASTGQPVQDLHGMSPSVRYCHRTSVGQLLQDLLGMSPSYNIGSVIVAGSSFKLWTLDIYLLVNLALINLLRPA